MKASPPSGNAAPMRPENAAGAATGGPTFSPENAQRILEERARLLALPSTAVSVAGETVDLLVFRRAADAYGVDAARVVELLARVRPTPLPGSRPFLPGVVHHRGRILAVVDVRGLLAPGAPLAGEGYMVVVTAGAASLALFADDIQGVSTIAVEGITAPASAQAGGSAWVRGTSAGMVTVLDVEALARDARLTVDEAGA